MLIGAKSGLSLDGALGELWIRTDAHQILEIGFGSVDNPDLRIDGTLIPGFFDIHCHGGAGFYFADDSVQNIKHAIDFHNQHGTSSIIASLVTTSNELLEKQIVRLANLVEEKFVSGIHLEGPYLSPKKSGAHNQQLLRSPEIGEIQVFLELGRGFISMVTIAPELDNALPVIEFLLSQGVVAAIGHTAATPLEVKAAIDAGAQVVTHFNNAMVKMDLTVDSAAEYLLKHSSLPLEVILDNEHLSAEVSKCLTGDYSSRSIAVTDAMSAAGCGDGEYFIGELEVEVKGNVARLKDGDALAGSTLTMDRAFFNILESGSSISDAVNITSRNAGALFPRLKRSDFYVGSALDFLILSDSQRELKRLGDYL